MRWPHLHRSSISLALMLAGVLCGPARAAEPGSTTPPRAFDSPAAALRAIPLLAQDGDEGPKDPAAPVVIGFGEFHELKGAPKVDSALRRFTRQLLPELAGRLTDLVVETWITEGNCGEREETVVKDVAKTTRRPETTESEIVTMVKQAKAAGAKPYALDLSCADYKALLDEGGQVDYDKMLRLLTAQLGKKVRLALARPRRALGQRPVVAVYGGGLHNDLYPQEALRDYTFGTTLQAELPGRYAEVDLYVPEYIERDGRIPKEPWYPAYHRAAAAAPGKTWLQERGPGSYILLFPRGVVSPPSPPTSPAEKHRKKLAPPQGP